MQNKKILFLLFFIVSILTISAAYASDNQTNNMVGSKDGLVNNNVEITYYNANFTELSNLIENTSENTNLTIDKDYTYYSGYAEGILINKSLTIDGKGHILDGANKSRIFQISNANIILKNIIFINGFSNDYGGAIYLKNSTAHLFNCTFNYNQGNDSGGAIYTSESDVNIFNSKFYYNSADVGGAICSEESFLDAYNSEFAHNIANYYGGCLFSNAILKINSSIFYDNKAGMKGGAIHSSAESAESGTLKVNNSKLFSNSAKYGGAISISNLGYNSIYNSQLYSNIATYGTVIARLSTNTLEIRNSSCYNNKGVNGTVIFAPSNGNIILKDSNFTNNTGNYGCLIFTIQGRFALEFSDYNTTVDSCSVLDNYAEDSLIYNFYGNINLNNSSFVYKNGQYPFFVIKKMSIGNINYENNYWGSDNPNFSKLIYINNTSQNLNSDRGVDNFDDECSSNVIQIDENHTVSSFRRDSSVETTVFISGDGEIRHEKFDKSYFMHMIVTKEGWVIGNGGMDSPYQNEKIEAIAKNMIKNNEISERYLELILSLKSLNKNRGHFIIKSPDGRFGIVNFYNETKTIEIGILKSGEYIISPNNYALHKKGNITDFPFTNYVEASRYLLGIDLYGNYRTTIQTFEYLKETVDNKIITYVDSYISNDDGHFINITGFEKYFNDIYLDGKYFLGEEIPIIMDGKFVNRFILDKSN